ncbi:hypothetical protein HUE87_10640 [Candidatus Sulfurimonas marisnigri]|uniref:Uncharacterized protein n=1 Tax=Candidatus Sulfurimonas marisnigri TaxID=2740405 RepID=A0A7S7LZH8_9BACT|nr:hypothetical protein [Candidatus Sulfurimonas marisnigri]QOY54321.1 hypothetical protein HUE87_10640 [Candidatus Sulfurimonas marisnigri]
MSEPLSDNALKLARGLYNTYITYDDLNMSIKFITFFKLLNLHPCTDSIRDIRNLLEELNEPLAVKNFEFHGKTTQLKFIQFCNYEIGEETIQVRLSPEYLHAHDKYMLDTFLNS